MLKFCYILLISVIFVPVFASKFEYDLLKLFEIEDLKDSNGFDGEFYWTPADLKRKNLTLDFGEALQDDEEIVFDIVFRIYHVFFNFAFRPILITSLDDGNELMFKIFRFLSDNASTFLSIKSTTKNSKFHKDTHRFGGKLDLYQNSSWHYIKISFSNKRSKLWVDCQLVYDKPIEEKERIMSIITGKKEQTYDVRICYHSFYDFEHALKKYTITRQKIETAVITNNQICPELEDLNAKVSKPLDLTQSFGEMLKMKYLKTDRITGETFYRIDKNFVRYIPLPKSFLEYEKLGNIALKIKFRYGGAANDILNIFTFSDFGEDNDFGIDVRRSCTFNYFYRTSDGGTQSLPNNFKINDGNWHNLEVYFIPNRRESNFMVRTYIDCNLIGDANIQKLWIFETSQLVVKFFDVIATQVDIMSSSMDSDVKNDCYVLQRNQ